MNLDSMTISVRERSLPEVYDLALSLCRQHGGDLAILLLTAAAPWVALDWWLLHGSEPGDWSRCYAAFLLLLAQAPMVSAPLTAYLGEAMFSTAPRKRAALRQAGRRWFALLLFGALRGMLGLMPILLMFYPVHAAEVLLLERQGLRAAWRRSYALLAGSRGESLAHLAVGAVVLATSLLVTVWSCELLIGLLVWGLRFDEDVMPWLNPGYSVVPLILVWPLVGFLAVVRFLAYLDLRTRNEGWEIELELRRAARRMRGGDEP